MKTFLVLMLFLGMAFNARAEDRLFLYGNYYSGMSYEDFLKTGPAQCDDFANGKKICNRQKVVFAAGEWTQFFEFKKNALTCVAFGHPLSMTAISAAMAWLQDENYAPIEAEAGKKSISFLPLYDNNKSEFEKEAEPFSQDLLGADDFRAYLIKKSILNEHKTMDKLPPDTMIVTLGGSKRRGTIFVCFETVENFTLEPSR